jgi:hypothetical protein
MSNIALKVYSRFKVKKIAFILTYRLYVNYMMQQRRSFMPSQNYNYQFILISISSTVFYYAETKHVQKCSKIKYDFMIYQFILSTIFNTSRIKCEVMQIL